MKRVVAMFLSLVLILAVAAGCSSKTGQTNPSDPPTNNSTPAEQTGNPSTDPVYQPGKYKLNVDHGHTETSVTHEAALRWADAVRERTHGEVEITVYYSFQLGTVDDLLVQIMQGGSSGYLADPGRLGNYWSEIGVLNAPYVVESYDEILRLEDSDLFKEWEDKLVDGCEQNIGSVYDNAIYEVAPYFIETRHVYLSNAMVVSDSFAG